MQLQHIQRKIYEIRGMKVMLDFDLAELYEVETKNLNKAVYRNSSRFPEDFMFRLTKEEWVILRFHFGTSSHGGTRYLPYAFTEQGLAMLSGILHSEKAIEVNIAIMRAFVFLRQYALTHKDLTEQLKALETKYNTKFEDVYEAIRYLLKKDEHPEERKPIGFKEKNKNARTSIRYTLVPSGTSLSVNFLWPDANKKLQNQLSITIPFILQNSFSPSSASSRP